LCFKIFHGKFSRFKQGIKKNPTIPTPDERACFASIIELQTVNNINCVCGVRKAKINKNNEAVVLNSKIIQLQTTGNTLGDVLFFSFKNQPVCGEMPTFATD
jgi:hypothetical protein